MRTSIVTALITRPADTTAYTAGDVIGAAAIPFTPMGPSIGLGGQIKAGAMISSNNAATKPDIELWLFSSTVASVTADNAPFAPTDAEAATLIGIIPFPVASWKVGNSGSTTGGNAVCAVNAIDIPCGNSTVYGVIVVRNAYQPITVEAFTISLGVLNEYANI